MCFWRPKEMEKNLKRVQRWIERCIAACRSEKWDSALAEVECARAELESAGEEIWRRASGSDDPHRVGQFVGLSLRSLAVALMVIMAAAIPISTGGYAPGGVADTRQLRLEWVTTDEQSVLSALRNSLSEMNLARENLYQDFPAEETPPSPIQKSQPATDAPSVAMEESRAPAEALDEILSLIEIGQRALRGEGIVLQSSE